MRGLKIGMVLLAVVGIFGAGAIAFAASGSDMNVASGQDRPSVRPTPHAEKSRTPEPPETETAAGNAQSANAIAKYFGVSIEQVKALRQQGLGWGEISHAYALAKASGKSVDGVVAQFKSGQGWGEIAKQLGVSPSHSDDNLGKILHAEKENDKPKGTPTAPGKSEEHRKDEGKSRKEE